MSARLYPPRSALLPRDRICARQRSHIVLRISGGSPVSSHSDDAPEAPVILPSLALHISRVDFPTATPEQLQLLAQSCQPAKFGVNQQDVFDETYRKASKLDAEDFVVRFDPVRSGVLDIVHSELAIDRLVKQDAIRAELYKLNIYGASSCVNPPPSGCQ